jgi:predicted nucleic acid-binding protein
LNRFFDTSAFVALLRDEPSTATVVGLDASAREVYGSQILFAKSITAIHRWMREGHLSGSDRDFLRERLNQNLMRFRIQPIDDRVNASVVIFTEKYPLRAADAIQLASWSVLQAALDEQIAFVCLDHRLREAAVREGGVVEPATLP